jgi:spermidine synthase
MSAVRSRVYVREGRQGRELRVDGTLASVQLRDGRVTGPVWYALAAPLLALAKRRPPRILILGLGAGSAAQLLRRLAPRAHIVGVELDGDVVAAARAHFDLDALGVDVRVCDARELLARERRLFDYIVEDVFVGTTRTLRKPAGWPRPMLDLAVGRLAPGGVLVVNTIHEGPTIARTLMTLAPRWRPAPPNRGVGTFLCVGVKGFYNRILALGPPELRPALLRARLATTEGFASAAHDLRLSANLRSNPY